MPISTSWAPACAAPATTSSSMGTMASVPSMLKRFWPKKVRCRKRSKPSTWLRRRSSAFLRSGGSGWA